MKNTSIATLAGGALLAFIALAQTPSAGPYKVVKTAKVGGCLLYTSRCV